MKDSVLFATEEISGSMHLCAWIFWKVKLVSTQCLGQMSRNAETGTSQPGQYSWTFSCLLNISNISFQSGFHWNPSYWPRLIFGITSFLRCTFCFRSCKGFCMKSSSKALKGWSSLKYGLMDPSRFILESWHQLNSQGLLRLSAWSAGSKGASCFLPQCPPHSLFFFRALYTCWIEALLGMCLSWASTKDLKSFLLKGFQQCNPKHVGPSLLPFTWIPEYHPLCVGIMFQWT